MITTIGNFLWFVLGGVLMGLVWMLFGLLAFITIIGIPWSRACFEIAEFVFFPFGKEAINRDLLASKSNIGTGSLGIIGDIIWFIFAGLWLAIAHIFWALCWVLVSCFTIDMLPFVFQHLKLARIALAPLNKTIVTKEAAEEAIRQNAESNSAKQLS